MSDYLSAKETERMEDFLADLRKIFPNLPIRDTDRNKKLRPELLKRILAEILTDDERATLYGLPEGCRMREGAKIIAPENLKIGQYCWIGENAVLDASGGLEIGSHTSIGLSVFVWSHSSHLTNLSMQNEAGSNLIQRQSTKVGSGVFIAGPSVILPGVTIGDNVLIRPFTTVASDVPSRSLVDGGSIKEGVFTVERVRRMVQRKSR